MTKDKRPEFPNFGFGGNPEPAVATLEGCVDYAVLALGAMIVIGWLPTDVGLRSLALKTTGGVAKAIPCVAHRYAREDVNAQFEKAGRRPPFKAGFLAVLLLDSNAQAQLRECVEADSAIEIGIEESGVQRRFGVTPIRLTTAYQASVMTDQLKQLASRALSELRSVEAESAGQFLRGGASSDALNAHIDAALTADRSCVLLSGWAEATADNTLWLLDGDLMDAPKPLDAIAMPRNDVTTHLRTLGKSPTTNLHGFVAISDISDVGSYYLGRSTGSDRISWSKKISIEPQAIARNDLLGRMRRFASESIANKSDAFRKLSRVVLGAGAPAEPAVAEVKRYAPQDRAGHPIRTSIIVPFYGDDFYLVDHLLSQERAPDDVEWIFVCDDPRLSSQMIETLSNRRYAVRQPTTLVLLAANGGFAHANNIGASHARGEYLLLMNSDIYCADFAFLDHAAALMGSKSDMGCVGFSLQFEDGTIQHDGMSFEQSDWLDGLWVCEHKNKGMPQSWGAASETSVEAVTAALMLIRSSDFRSRHIFDPTYLVGDFEDADLCMRVRKSGKSIVLVRAGGLYHLERQSVRHTGDSDGRQAITHLNCMTFNDRWAQTLNSSIRHGKA